MLKIKASRAHIENMRGEMTVIIEGDEGDILSAFMNEYHVTDILCAMSEEQKQELTDLLFERYAVGGNA